MQMATQDKSGFKKAESPNSNNNDDDAVWIDRPAEGESVQGILLEHEESAGQYDTPLIKLRRTDDHDDDEGPVALMWTNKTIENKFQNNDIKLNSEVLIEATEKYTFTNDDGEEIEATDYEVYFKK